MKIIRWIFVVLLLLLLGCQSFRSSLYKGNKGIEYARINAIVDFVNTYKTPQSYLKERDGNPFNVFVIVRRKDLEQDTYVINILPETQKISLFTSDSIGIVPSSPFPTKYLIKNKKLFLWKDENIPLTKNVLSVMDKFNILDSTNLNKGYNTITISSEDGLEGVDYYICENNIKHYKKIKTNIATGYYSLPKLNCK